jgi:xylulokinase
LNWGHRKEYLYRAILESIAYDYRLGFKHIKSLFPDIEVSEILVTGGGSKSEIWNQIKADVLGFQYIRLGSFEYNLRGCGMIAACGSGLYETIDRAVLKMGKNVNEKTYVSDLNNHRIYSKYFNVFENAFQSTLKDTFHSLSEV